MSVSNSKVDVAVAVLASSQRLAHFACRTIVWKSHICLENGFRRKRIKMVDANVSDRSSILHRN